MLGDINNMSQITTTITISSTDAPRVLAAFSSPKQLKLMKKV
jgi:hypothetical protein